MSQTLYRKYRSQRFADIIGQAPVVRILQNSIVRGRLNHAYLFAGPRGTGKTSIARIFAKALNCLNPQGGDACGECEVCRAIASGTAVDVIEIDAASNRGIDDIRDLRERVNYAPLELKRKVYIIDEVHMITGPAWNALLKTLEEPPSHVIFCLCTTEANKVPITILSRCIRFDFQRLPLEALAMHLDSIAAAEGFVLEPGCGLKLAKLAEGSARDAISLLDQLTVYCDGAITAREIEELFQLGDPAHVRQVVDGLLAGDAATALAEWEGMLRRGVDAGTFLLQLSAAIKERYLEQPAAQTKAALDAVWQALNLLKYDSFPALLVELALIEAAGGLSTAPPPERPSAAAQTAAPRTADVQHSPRPPRTASKSAGTTTAAPPADEALRADPPTQLPVTSGTITADPQDTTPAAKAPEPVQTTDDLEDMPGDELLQQFRDKVHSLRKTTYVLLLQGVRAARDGNRLTLTFDDSHRQALAYAGQGDNLAVLREAARQLYGQHTVIELRRADSPATAVAGAEAAGHPPKSEADLAGASSPAPDSDQGEPEALESSSTNGSGDRPATYEDAVRLFGSEVEE